LGHQDAITDGSRHYLCVGIGVGPANLSLASLMYGHADMSNLFIEKKPCFGWHDGQQIPGTVLQVSMLKDLVSLADPTNPFSFLSYLHASGRIYHFLNAQFEAVPRQEFRNYMEWASRNNGNVVFGEEVLSVEFDDVFHVRTDRRTITADNISVGVGNRPWIPPHTHGGVTQRQFHVSEFLTKARGLGGLRVGVVGGGQSGAEAFLDLVSRPEPDLPRRVSWISRRPNYLPLDDSPFTNDFYMPCHSDYFATLPAPTRQSFNTRHLLTSDGITEATLRQIYQRIYIHRFLNDADDLVALYPNREVTTVIGDDAAGYDLTLVHNNHEGTPEHLDLDVIIWATGFRASHTEFLAPIAHRLEFDGTEYKIDQSFAAIWDGPAENNIFLQNAAHQQRGLADPNLSLVAWRSNRILDRMRGTRTEHQLSSFIEWTPKPPTDQL
jgi:lysine N6-hydroxylase